ncbi:MAG: WbqC family protein [Flavobacteriales bacterium]|nr:WbqC family protein [Flavobacteriales bacterium]
MVTLFPSAFLPSIHYVSKWFHAVNPAIYIGEKYHKQTCRNRTHILSSQGVLPLIIPVKNGSSSHLFMKNAVIVYTDRWQQRYWHSIISAYQNAPYFEHYIEELHQMWFQKDLYLYEYNYRLISWLFLMLGLPIPKIQEKLPDLYDDSLLKIDFLISEGIELPYKQVFSYKYPFNANVSVLDLLMNKGPEAFYWISHVKKNWI